MSVVSIKETAEILNTKKNILLLCHARPDGDTLGSAYGLKHAMEECGKRAEVVCSDKVPHRLEFISGSKTDLGLERLGDFSYDIIISVDCAERSLLGRYGDMDIDIKIDHHPGGSEYAKYNYIDPCAAAAGEIIYELVRELEKTGSAKLTKQSATALYAAVSSDTGCFKYSNVTSKTFRCAADLIDAGADYEEVSYRLFDSKTVNEVVAHRLILNGINMYRSGTVAVISITNQMIEENGITEDDFGGAAGYLREIEGIQLAISIKQESDDPKKYKVSMRSRAGIQANKLCAELGGGGHDRAAGASVIADSPEDAEYKVMQTVQSAIGYV